jgi:hypothetical protein
VTDNVRDEGNGGFVMITRIEEGSYHNTKWVDGGYESEPVTCSGCGGSGFRSLSDEQLSKMVKVFNDDIAAYNQALPTILQDVREQNQVLAWRALMLARARQ